MRKFIVLLVFVLVLLVSCQLTPEKTIEEQVVGKWYAPVSNFDYVLYLRDDNWAICLHVHNEEIIETEVFQWFIEDNLFVTLNEGERYYDVTGFNYSGDTLTLGRITYVRIS